MEYLYIAMFLQEIGKEITEANIQKIFNAVGIEFDENKVRLLIPALSILGPKSSKKTKKIMEPATFEQLTDLQKRFEVLQTSLAATNDRVQAKPMQPVVSEDCLSKEKSVTLVEPAIQQVTSQQTPTHKLPARYVYGIADKGTEENLGPIGIEGSNVYIIPYEDLCIIVHDCLAEPYQSEDQEVVKNWLFSHQEVLDAVAEKFGVVLPMSFDMIIEGKNGTEPEDEVKEWMKKNYDNFHEKVNWLRNKQEYGVQVMINTETLSQKLIETDEQLKIKKKEIDAKPKGIAYMEREILKDLIKEKLEQNANDYFKEFYNMIKECTDDIVIEKVKKVGGNEQMIMNLSCLVNKSKVTELGEKLDSMQKKDGVSSVRFSGPWAPYSFVTPEARSEE